MNSISNSSLTPKKFLLIVLKKVSILLSFSYNFTSLLIDDLFKELSVKIMLLSLIIFFGI